MNKYINVVIQMRAAKTGNHTKVARLLRDGADPNTKKIDTVSTVENLSYTGLSYLATLIISGPGVSYFALH